MHNLTASQNTFGESCIVALYFRPIFGLFSIIILYYYNNFFYCITQNRQLSWQNYTLTLLHSQKYALFFLVEILWVS